MATKVFSFQEVSLSMVHSSLGQLTITGKGAGTVKVSMAEDRTDKQVASDGTVVLSKIRNRSGNLDISVFNTSDFHASLKRWFNYLEQANAREWALTNAKVTSISTGESYNLTGVAFTKLPDAEYDTTAKMVDWSFIVADVQQDLI